MSQNIPTNMPGKHGPDTATSLPLTEAEVVNPTDPDNSYGQILKSSAIIGGSSLINILIGMIRTKFMAAFLGPSGIGLMGMYGSIIDLAQSISGMGLNSSGVRQIAEAVGTEDEEKIATTAKILRRTSVFLGLLGATLLYAVSEKVSTFSFGNNQHASSIAILSVTVFINAISAGQVALIQGMRRISDLAKMNILGTVYGTLFSITMVYLFHEDGIVISIVLSGAIALTTSFWYRRKIVTKEVTVQKKALEKEQYALLKLGFAFMSSGLMMTGATYFVRIFIVQNVGLDAAGLYQSAWNLGGLYIGFILQSMGTDFYPRLTAIVNDNAACNRMVNEQAHISLLLAGPGVLATLTFAPIIIPLFYNSQFVHAIDLLRWLCLGMALRVISWPMGIIIIAKNAQKLFFFSELAWILVYLGLVWVGVNNFGLNGVGIAFFGAYIFHVLMIYLIVRKLTDFRWPSANLKATLLYLLSISSVFVSFYILPFTEALFIGIGITLLCSVYSLRTILRITSNKELPRPLIKLLQLTKILRFLPISRRGN